MPRHQQRQVLACDKTIPATPPVTAGRVVDETDHNGQQQQPPGSDDETSPDTTPEENTMPRLSEELAQIEQEILDAVPELKEQIHGFVEQLQEALKMPLAPEHDSADVQPGEPIEI